MENRYYLVQRCELGTYGDEEGSKTREELNKLMENLDRFATQEFVIIKGHELRMGWSVIEEAPDGP